MVACCGSRLLTAVVCVPQATRPASRPAKRPAGSAFPGNSGHGARAPPGRSVYSGSSGTATSHAATATAVAVPHGVVNPAPQPRPARSYVQARTAHSRQTHSGVAPGGSAMPQRSAHTPATAPGVHGVRGEVRSGGGNARSHYPPARPLSGHSTASSTGYPRPTHPLRRAAPVRSSNSTSTSNSGRSSHAGSGVRPRTQRPARALPACLVCQATVQRPDAALCSTCEAAF